ncbi:MAG: hypothetical protein JO100_14185 [Pseudonocardia sp.]|nr:hypothetical protein [Pseudonocardia sp.]
MTTRLERFLAFSADATAFTRFELQGTGQAREYLDTVVRIAGDTIVDRLLDLHLHAKAVAAASGNSAIMEHLLRRDVLSDPRLGPVARNIVKMWFVGIWYELPREWTEAFGAREGDVTFVVSGTAYAEGLLWRAIGANPPGAKAPGYGSWALPPHIPALAAH